MEQPNLFFNGIDLDKPGEDPYIRHPETAEHFFGQLLATEAIDPIGSRDVIYGADPLSIPSSGWAMVAHEKEDPRVLEALAPLCENRQAQAGARFKQLIFKEGDNKDSFMLRHGAGRGNVNPDKLPYYLLIVGDPKLIPFWFQFEMDISYAVGRLCFEDPQGYAHYVRNLLEYERNQVAKAHRLVLLGVENGDGLTALCDKQLMAPLNARVRASPRTKEWFSERIPSTESTRQQMSELMGGSQTPSLLFTLSHGVTASNDAQLREQVQGGLVCADWRADQAIKRSHCFLAEDLQAEADLSGLITFFFACYTGGTPEFDGYPMPHRSRRRLHHKSFVARLPQAMLGRKNGALAVIAHVDQAYQQSFLWDERVNEIDHFSETLCRMMEGECVGHAMEAFNRRFADIAASLMGREFSFQPPSPQERKLASWLAFQDARSFILLGDPAVRLATKAREVCS